MSLAALLAASAVIFLAALALESTARRLDVAVPLVFLGLGLALGALSGTARGVVDAAHLQTAGTIALVLILVDGGLRTGIVALRRELAPVLVLGIGGTLVTFLLVSAATHWVAGLGWTLAVIVGAALSPTDPAAVFSVLHGRGGGSRRVATVLEGEAGFNDPVAIALVIALVDAARHGHDAGVLDVGWIMLREGAVGAVVGIGLAFLLGRLLSSRAPNLAVAPALVVGLGAFLAFGVADVAHGSGFLAAYLYGLMLSDRLGQARASIVALNDQLSSLAEVGLFVLLGVALETISLRGSIADAIAIAALIVFVIRPLVAGPVLGAFGLGRSGSIFGVWGGLKGAVPILLGSFPLAHGLAAGDRLFALVGLVVVLTLLVQGLTLGRLARRLGI
ncbi:MAG: cation:proton antiporter [Gaiellales bacterium]